MSSVIERVEQALNDLRMGKMIILTDHHHRENEGDLIMAAEKITISAMNFFIKYTSGIVCLPIDEEIKNKFQLKYMVPLDQNHSLQKTPFTISIEAKKNITTGVSAMDRCHTVLTMVDDQATVEDIVSPGHIFPLCARKGGVLEREGHTEGSIDLMKLAGLKSVAVLAEIINEDGSMARETDLLTFSNAHQLTLISIEDIITYRLMNESMIDETATVQIPTQDYGVLTALAIKEKIARHEHMVLYHNINVNQPNIVRIHSSCLTGDVFHSLRCDCHAQLHYSLEQIKIKGGVLIYLNQEGRGVGLFNKMKAYHLQDNGLDTIEAQKELGLPIDLRKYYIAAHILKYLNISKVKLLTSNPKKLQSLKQLGIENVVLEKMPDFENDINKNYLKTKREKLFVL